MPWDSALVIGALVLIIIGGAAAILSEKAATRKGGRLLWAIALIFLTTALAYFIATQALNWF
jgi:hypothetical protein